MYCDNQIAIHSASYSMFHGRTKHMEVDYHFIREIVMRKKVITPYNKLKIGWVMCLLKL